MLRKVFFEGVDIYRSFTLSQINELHLSFPKLTEPVIPSDPHRILPISHKYPLEAFKCPEKWHVEYIDNKSDITEQKGETGIVAFHGFPRSAHEFTNLMKMMAERSIRMICKDIQIIGPVIWGVEQIQQNDVKIVNFTNLAKAVVTLVKALGLKKIILVGHSFGTFVCQTIAHQFPEWVGGMLEIAGGSMRFNYGNASATKLSVCLFQEMYKERSLEKLAELEANPQKWTPALLEPFNKRHPFHFGPNPYKPYTFLNIGRYADVYQLLCLLKYGQELPEHFYQLRSKLNIPVFIALGTDDPVVQRTCLLEYCKEKYRGKLRVSTAEAIVHSRKTCWSKQPQDKEVIGFADRLRSGMSSLSEIEEENLLQIRGASHVIHLTQTPLIGAQLIQLVKLVRAIELVSQTQPKI